MYEIREQHFQALNDRNSSRLFTGIHFINCSFLGCGFSITDNPTLRSRAVGLRFTNCTVQGCGIDPGILDEVVVDGLRTKGLLQCWGTAFRHVVLKGRVGKVMISSTVSINLLDTPKHVPIQQAFDQANQDFYRTVDWALDISQAEFEDVDLRGVPAHLVRRDPATQVVVTREKAIQGAWREVDLSGTHWATSMDFLLRREDQAVVLVAPKRSKNFRRLLDGLELLRKAGVAEWD